MGRNKEGKDKHLTEKKKVNINWSGLVELQVRSSLETGLGMPTSGP